MAARDLSTLQAKMDDLALFLHRYSPLTECHLVNFITHDLYRSLLPSDLSELLLTLTDVELSLLPSYKLMGVLIANDRNESCRVLIALLKTCRQFAIESFSDEPIMRPYLASVDEVCRMRKLSLSYCTDKKKCHEVEVMASAVATMANLLATDVVVDIGSGRGYLGSLMAMYYGMRVLGFDASDCNTNSASQRLEQVKREWRTVLQQAGVREDVSNKKGVFQPVTCSVTASTDLNSVADDCELVKNHEPLVVCGLHTCGDLAAHAIKMFIECQRARGLLLVGCCYHLVEEKFSRNPFRKGGDPPLESYGFPLSSHFRGTKFGIGRNTRTLASQPVCKMAKNTMLPDKSLFWRAMLQQIVWEKFDQKIDIFERRVGRVAKHCVNFTDYVPRALKKLELDIQITKEEMENYENRYSQKASELVAFFQLRCAFAQPVETAMLMDRLYYLLEQDSISEAKIVPLFDPTISPRCYAIWAIKK